jgi:hypothetical protein
VGYINLSIFHGSFHYVCVILYQVSKEHPKFSLAPPINGPKDRIFVWLHSLVWVRGEVWPVRYLKCGYSGSNITVAGRWFALLAYYLVD